jgi:hypothetical protein
MIKRISITDEIMTQYYICEYIFRHIENNKSIDCITFVDKILHLKDKQLIKTIIVYINDLYTDYMYAILFNQYNMNELDSGENKSLEFFKNKYEITKTFYCTISKKNNLYNLIVRNISNIQNINQSNP